MWRVIDAERRCSGSSLPNLYYPVAGPAAFRDLAYLRRESGSPKVDSFAPACLINVLFEIPKLAAAR
jgi:hypothetical protein